MSALSPSSLQTSLLWNAHPTEVVKPPIFKDNISLSWGKCAKNVLCSRTFKVIVGTIALLGAGAFLLTTPPGWAILGIAISSLALKLLLIIGTAAGLLITAPIITSQLSKLADLCLGRDKGKFAGQTLEFELSAIHYRRKQEKGRDQFNIITVPTEQGPPIEIGLGVAPRLDGPFASRLNSEGFTAIVNVLDNALNEDRTRSLRLDETGGGHFQYQGYNEGNLHIRYDEFNHPINYAHYPIEDHALPSPEWLNRVAQTIHLMIRHGEKVYVHCRGGVGRSSLAICAYLIKYHGYTAPQAADHVKNFRKKATCARADKLACLTAFQDSFLHSIL